MMHRRGKKEVEQEQENVEMGRQIGELQKERGK